jgi:hypothetical protein
MNLLTAPLTFLSRFFGIAAVSTVACLILYTAIAVMFQLDGFGGQSLTYWQLLGCGAAVAFGLSAFALHWLQEYLTSDDEESPSAS